MLLVIIFLELIWEELVLIYACLSYLFDYVLQPDEPSIVIVIIPLVITAINGRPRLP